MKVKALDREGKLVMVLHIANPYGPAKQQMLDRWMQEFKVHHPMGSFQIS